MLGEHKAKTYLCLLKHIKRIVMKRFQDRKEQCATWNSEIPPTVNAKIIKASRKSRLLKMLSAGNGEYELLGETRVYVVKLNLRSCECEVWQISEVPCSHVLAGIGRYLQHKDDIVEFVHPSLTKTVAPPDPIRPDRSGARYSDFQNFSKLILRFKITVSP
ncbi:hypothetical protein ACOSP7_019555 [Xanthoceras sorbifolium]